ncbi:MAG TPA: hypothetical protein VFZ14_04180 [Burkholderiales bacterium]|nr:hypothetical protein [Burkholderiales bacterium]
MLGDRYRDERWWRRQRRERKRIRERYDRHRAEPVVYEQQRCRKRLVQRQRRDEPGRRIVDRHEPQRRWLVERNGERQRFGEWVGKRISGRQRIVQRPEFDDESERRRFFDRHGATRQHQRVGVEQHE